MLAVKRILCSQDLVSLYVFDEVDTGLGGKAADSIGKKIQAVASGHQAIAITHLAPIAARADHHVYVTKQVARKRTVSQIERLSPEARADEIARMIDGAEVSETTRAAAREMLSRSQST
jgi:DNA repair protein RecN (Recombination protein N)